MSDVTKEAATLFRPVGPNELALIRDSGFAVFPPRLPEQPIFYPVLDSSYAEQIARDWNSMESGTGFRGFATEFDIASSVLERYDVHTVGARTHQELWVPAEELAEFNRAILGPIRVVAAFHKGTAVEVAAALEEL